MHGFDNKLEAGRVDKVPDSTEPKIVAPPDSGELVHKKMCFEITVICAKSIRYRIEKDQNATLEKEAGFYFESNWLKTRSVLAIKDASTPIDK